ncbi:MAG: lipoate--protein ligase family protein [Chlamydiales bacterium]
MELDKKLLSSLENEKEPILHLYDWEGESATYGYFIKPLDYFNSEGVSKHGLNLARRPTGGGIVFHNCDLAFSVLVPASFPSFSLNPLDNYHFINHRVMSAIQQLLKDLSIELLPEELQYMDLPSSNFCMAKPTKFDVMIRGKKVCGAAMRKTRQGYLYQGSILLGFLSDDYLRDLLIAGKQVIEKMRQNSLAILGENWTFNELQETRRHLRELLQHAFSF